ncbi:hypothetical protein CSKR_103003 [Clonorchis sinensis]|uniref:AAA+ ATPase domain-containing protein n=1 Tax=Clonorchis sinensis TaxID=79923 RepID=A0A8T1M5H0_CLOSI|nr:hypothetical protein CSKR_103003 [Clonorchis sinensis]
MKIKVATTFSFRTDSKDGQNEERFISSALTFEPNEECTVEGGHCQCGTDYEEDDNPCPVREACIGHVSDDQTSEPNKTTVPRFMIIGKPCTGKTTLAKQLCNQFGCELVNASELVQYHLSRPTEQGILIDETMRGGNDLSDEMVLAIIKTKLESEQCKQNGYVIDGIPTHSERSMTIEEQLDYIFSLENGPTHLIEIQISNEDLRTRWEDIRIDHLDGKLYPKPSYDASTPTFKSPIPSPDGHPDFPKISDATKSRLLTRHEELPENLDKHFQFYDEKVGGKVEGFLAKHDQKSVITVDGRTTPSERFYETMTKLGELPKQINPDDVVIQTDPAILEAFSEGRAAFGENPPRIIMVGKPSTGKTTLAKMLSQAWGCLYLNASELITRHIEEKSGRGLEVISIMQSGEDLSDILVFNIINEALQSPECKEKGYILDGMPNYSEKLLTIPTQLEFLARVYPEPAYWVLIDIPDPELRARWEAVRIDHATGKLYPKASYDVATEPTGHCDFPVIDEEMKKRLLIRHEELPENVELSFRFYNEHVEQPLDKFIKSLDPATVIRLDGTQCPKELGKELLLKLNDMPLHQEQRRRSIPVGSIQRDTTTTDSDIPAEFTAAKQLWQGKPPRLVMVGKPCTGKTLLAKKLCTAWGCRYINASELIAQHLEAGTGRGQQILKILQAGEDLSDIMVFNLLNEAIQSPECRTSGYILDGLPNYSQQLLNISTQLEFLARLYPAPYYWVDFDISDEELRARWETVRVDHVTGALYSSASYGLQSEVSGSCEFPRIDEETKKRLLTRHEELPEILDQHFKFYNECVSTPLMEFLGRCSVSSVIYLDGTLCPDEMGKALIDSIKGLTDRCGLRPSKVGGSLERLRMVSISKGSHADAAGVQSSDELNSPCLIRIKKRSTTDNESDGKSDEHKNHGCCHECGAKFSKLPTQIWEQRKPRFLIVGKPCTGKTTLARCMASTWNCELVNASELIQKHMELDDNYGKQIKQLMVAGQDLDDMLVINIMKTKLESPECLENGYVIDSFPTFSEKALSVARQLDFLDSLNPGPEYVIDLQIPDSIMRDRWKAVKFDLETGDLLSPISKQGRHLPNCCFVTCTRKRPRKHGQLITRHEELAENMEANIAFYQDVVEPQLRDWLERRFGDMIIPMDADISNDELFQVLQRKMQIIESNPSCSPRQLFTAKEKAYLGACCRRCGTRYGDPEPLPNLWTDKPPRFVIFGKPCTGKTTLAKGLCTLWNCELVNATDLVHKHLSLNTEIGQKIRGILDQGQDLSDQFVLDMLVEKLNSPGCAESGYILDGIPTFSEKSKSIGSQIEFLKTLNPEYIINIMISDEDLRKRWETVRIDVSDGALYMRGLTGKTDRHERKDHPRVFGHPEFPNFDKPTITRHEELPENLDQHFIFQHAHVSPRIKEFIQAYDQSKIITLDGKLSSMQMLNNVLHKLNVMSTNPNTSTRDLFDEKYSEDSNEQVSTVCGCDKQITLQIDSLPELWLNKPPRVVILGKPRSGKTTLAKGLSTLWDCELITLNELIEKEVNSDSMIGAQIRASMADGPGLSPPMIMEMINVAINKPRSVSHGYILDGPPTNSSDVGNQLRTLCSLPNGPEYVIELKISDAELRERWQASCMDTTYSSLYNELKTGETGSRRCPASKRGIQHPDFPNVDEKNKDRLLAKVEDVGEDVDKYLDFYQRYMSEQLKNFISSHDPAAVVKVNANLPPSFLLQSVVTRLSIMAKHPGVPSSLLFRRADDSDVEELDSTGCECRYEDRQEKPLESNLKGSIKHSKQHSWPVPNITPRILIVGNSCSGKTTLAKRLCKEWGCVMINATELITQHICAKTPLGDQIQQIMRTGEDLSDSLVLDMLKDKLSSPDCEQSGYILDDFPTSSEKGLNIGQQLDMLLQSEARPNYIVDIQIPEADLKRRWEAVRIDISDGMLYPKSHYRFSDPATPIHPVFPAPNENIRQRLLTRHEEMMENIEKQTEFYHNHVRPQIDAFLKEYGPECVIPIDGRVATVEMCQTMYKKISEALTKSATA